MPVSFWPLGSEVSERLRVLVAERAYHVCEYCLIHEEDTFWGCQVDHIIRAIGLNGYNGAHLRRGADQVQWEDWENWGGWEHSGGKEISAN